jgi:hypothetical protein
MPSWQSRILGSNWRNLARSGAHLVVREEVKRESLGAIPYGPDEHKLNPYIGGNLQAINEFIKRDSELAAFYKQEAEPVSLPLFGPNRNLTVEGRLYRDPHAASVLKISRANESGSGLRTRNRRCPPGHVDCSSYPCHHPPMRIFGQDKDGDAVG